MLIFEQLLNLIFFLLISLVVFTFPGFFILQLVKLPKFGKLENFFLSTVLGLAVFTVVAYLLAAVHLRFLGWGFIPLGFWSIYKYFPRKTWLKLPFSKLLTSLFCLVVISGIIFQVAVNAFSGLPHEDGIYFYSSHGHDGVWHLALMEEMHKDVFPFQNPELAGAQLQNYHFFVDLLMSEMTRLFPFSNLDIYFRLMPVLFSLLMGLGGYILVRNWTKSRSAGLWSMVMIYFCGSFGYLMTIPRNHNLVGESIFWVSQTQSVLGNPPHASAFIIMMAFLILVYHYLQQQHWGYFFLAAFLGGVVIEFKVYAGVLILGGLVVIGLWQIIRQRKFDLFFLFLLTLAIASIIYLPNSKNSQDFLIWQPWWYIRTMVVASDRLNWLDLELRRQTYISEHNWKRVFQLETTAFLIFLFGNLGMRFVGFWSVFKMLRKNIFKDYFNLLFLSMTTAAFILPVLFVQKGVAWNSIQFNQYFLLLFGFLGAISIAGLLERIKPFGLKTFLAILIFILAVPTQIGLLMQFYGNQPLSKITYEESGTLKVLQSQSAENAIVLTYPFDKYKADKFKPPIPIYAWYDTGYVPATIGRRTLLSDTEQVNIMGYQVEDIKLARDEAFASDDPLVVNNFLHKYQIDFVYLVYGQEFTADTNSLDLELLTKTDNTTLFKVRK